MLALTLVFAAAVAGQATSPPVERHLPARVFIFTAQDPGRGTPEERQGLLDSARDLEDLLGGRKKYVTLVRSAEDADVVIEVVNREEREPAQGGFGGASMTKFSDRIVRVHVKAGDKVSDLKGVATGSWKAAAKDAAERITKWIGNLYDGGVQKKTAGVATGRSPRSWSGQSSDCPR